MSSVFIIDIITRRLYGRSVCEITFCNPRVVIFIINIAIIKYLFLDKLSEGGV
jgi:hypothetical protein